MINTCKTLIEEHGLFFEESVEKSVQHFYDSHKNDLLIIEKRTKANFINDYIYFELMKTLGNCKDFKFINVGNKKYILYKNFFVIKVKKLNHNYCASFIPTHSAVKFNSQEQLELFKNAENIYFGYIMDEFNSDIEKILFVCPDNSNKKYKWIIDIKSTDIVNYNLFPDNNNERAKGNRFRKNSKERKTAQ